MSYVQFDSVQASDFNTLAGGATPAINTHNITWATGSGSSGYGQTALANVSAGGTVTAAAQWTTLVTDTSNAAIHQGTTITSVTAPAAGATITYNSAIPTNLQTIYSNRLNASIQGSSTSNTATFGSVWQNSLTFTFSATFANGDAARYFFNSGGQIKMTCSHPAGTGINELFNALSTEIGNVVLSAPTSGTATIVGSSYSGITRVGGTGNAPSPYLTNNGYYALTSANATVLSQTTTTGPSSYLASNISFLIKSNGTQGSNGDAGSVVTIYAVWDEVPDGLQATTGSATTMTLVYPETTYIANTWGAATLSGAVTGS